MLFGMLFILIEIWMPWNKPDPKRTVRFQLLQSIATWMLWNKPDPNSTFRFQHFFLAWEFRFRLLQSTETWNKPDPNRTRDSAFATNKRGINRTFCGFFVLGFSSCWPVNYYLRRSPDLRENAYQTRKKHTVTWTKRMTVIQKEDHKIIFAWVWIWARWFAIPESGREEANGRERVQTPNHEPNKKTLFFSVCTFIWIFFILVLILKWTRNLSHSTELCLSNSCTGKVNIILPSILLLWEFYSCENVSIFQDLNPMNWHVWKLFGMQAIQWDHDLRV